ncbi:hypothetical protein [Roseiconus lacunae]|uniref:Protein BatD n=1 Tax=Roseiconus lacunae TaxID=2605694 RepID=A0ABT7PCP5_9BACT|nr:hypothetical protein [Roseiconus lacunae]MDM4013991.1 hypothetical protein [Roseiconus lacunae]
MKGFIVQSHPDRRHLPIAIQRAIVCLAVIAMPTFASMTASAQDDKEVTVEIAKQKPPHYVGMGVTLQFTVHGLESKPKPTCEIKSSDPAIGGTVTSVSPRIFQQLYQSGGQLRRIQNVTHVVQVQIDSDRAGTFDVGPFIIRQGNTETEVDAIKLTFQDVPENDEMRIELVMPEVAYPDQRVEIEVRWAFAGETGNINSLLVSSPVFDQFRFVPDEQGDRRSAKMPIRTSQGTVALKATTSSETIDDESFTVLSAKRTFIPDRSGEYDFDPINATVQLVTRWQQQSLDMGDFGFGRSLLEEAFGGRSRPAEVQLFRVTGDPIHFEVKPFPDRGRPESFAGAVGSGFAIDVAADRTVLHAGDPIRLSINLRGDGNLENATLPSLFADGGLDRERFQVPDGDVTGIYDPETSSKSFEVLVRIEDESVDEIPALAYSWFDPQAERYRTTRSSPIAMRVKPAQMVTADAVVSSNVNQAGSTTDAQSDGTSRNSGEQDEPNSTASRTEQSLVLTGADLSITTEPSVLFASTEGWLANRAFQWSAYAIGLLCLIWSFIDRKRRRVDPSLRQTKTLVSRLHHEIESAVHLPEKPAAAQVADALRKGLRELHWVDRDAVQTLIGKCEAIEFRPTDSADKKLDRALIDDAIKHIGDGSHRRRV